MSTKKDAALDALHNLHFADRAAGSDLLEKLYDALEEIAAEREAAAKASDEVLVTLDEPPVGSEPGAPADAPVTQPPADSAEPTKDA